MRYLVFIIIIFALALIEVKKLYAGGMSYIDFGYRRNGMLTVMGKPDDPTAIFHNPAGLADQDGQAILLQLCGRIANFSANIFKQDGTKTDKISPGYVFAANPFISYTNNFGVENLGFGIGFYVPTGIGAVMPENEPTRYHVTFGYGFGCNLTASVAYRPHEVISIGVGVSAILFLFHIENYVNLGGYLLGLTVGDWEWRFDESYYNNALDYKVEIDGWDITGNFNAGILLNPVPWFSFGICYTHWADIMLDGTAEIKNVQNPSDREIADQTTVYYIPGFLRMGVNFEIGEYVELGLDYTVNFYSLTPDQITRLHPASEDTKMSVLKLNPTDPEDERLGLKTTRDLWENHNISTGILVHVLKDAPYAKLFDLMAGFQYDKTPYPTEAFTLLSPTRDYIGVNIGMRWLINIQWMIGFGFGFTYGWDIYVTDSISTPPLNVDATGYLFHVLINAVFRFDLDISEEDEMP